MEAGAEASEVGMAIQKTAKEKYILADNTEFIE